MNSFEKEKQREASPLVRLKEKWRTLDEAERDYWRAELNSRRKSLSVRNEIAQKLGVMLSHDVQLTHFRKWVKEQDQREAEVQLMRECASLPPRTSDDPALQPLAAVEWLYRRCLRDLQRGALYTLLYPQERRAFRKYARRKVDQFHADIVRLWVLAWLAQPAPSNSRN